MPDHRFARRASLRYCMLYVEPVRIHLFRYLTATEVSSVVYAELLYLPENENKIFRSMLRDLDQIHDLFYKFRNAFPMRLVGYDIELILARIRNPQKYRKKYGRFRRHRVALCTKSVSTVDSLLTYIGADVDGVSTSTSMYNKRVVLQTMNIHTCRLNDEWTWHIQNMCTANTLRSAGGNRIGNGSTVLVSGYHNDDIVVDCNNSAGIGMVLSQFPSDYAMNFMYNPNFIDGIFQEEITSLRLQDGKIDRHSVTGSAHPIYHNDIRGFHVSTDLQERLLDRGRIVYQSLTLAVNSNDAMTVQPDWDDSDLEFRIDFNDDTQISLEWYERYLRCHGLNHIEARDAAPVLGNVFGYTWRDASRVGS
ncbi:hypothetical protein RRF57_009203 [Xylaria bambusicola]|uniref:Uncharacterized protein n=1 Tax=Xylaria bambusicola TaxID=326684 RepID=A0AAN7UT97_9PEZI